MTRRLAAPSRTLTLACGLALTTPTLAAAALGLGPERHFPPASPFADRFPDPGSAALNSRGDAVVGERALSASGGLVTPMVRQRTSARGAWSRIIRLAGPAGDATVPLVAIDDTGRATAVFRHGGRYLSARRTSTTGRWALAPVGAPLPAGGADGTALAVGSGRSVFAHALPDSGCDVSVDTCGWTVAVYRARGGGAWTRDADSLRVAGARATPALDVNRRGDVLVSWVTAGPSGRVLAVRRLAGDTVFEAPQTLSTAVPAERTPMASIGASGDAAVGWIRPDPPAAGSTTSSTGRIEVVLRRATSATWSAEETAVGPGVAGLSGDLAIDRAANIALAWTTFPVAPTPTARVRVAAAIRNVATGQWVNSPELVTGQLDETVDVTDVRYERTRAYVAWSHDLGPGANVSGLAIGTVAGRWSSRPGLTSSGLAPVLAAAPDGDLLSVEGGLRVRNYDAAVTPPLPRAIGPKVTVTGRRAAITFGLTTPATVTVRRQGPPDLRAIGEYPPRNLGRGANRVPLGTLSPGRYLVALGVCTASRGCSTTRFLAFRIR